MAADADSCEDADGAFEDTALLEEVPLFAEAIDTETDEDTLLLAPDPVTGEAGEELPDETALAAETKLDGVYEPYGTAVIVADDATVAGTVSSVPEDRLLLAS